MFRLIFCSPRHDVLYVTHGTGQDLRQILQPWYFLLLYSWDLSEDGCEAIANNMADLLNSEAVL
jgi:hypothetical protein